MTKLKSVFWRIVAIFLALIAVGVFLMPRGIKQEELVRSIDVDSIGTVSYREKAEEIVGAFDSYNGTYDEEEGLLCFDGQMTLPSDMLKSLDFVSSYDEEVVKEYKATLDPASLQLHITVNYYQDDERINQEYTVATAYYEESADDWKVDVDGESMSVKTLLTSDNLENCAVAEAVVGTGVAVMGAAMFVSVVIACAPVIEQMVTTVVNYVMSAVQSFWAWLTGLFQWEQRTETIVEEVRKYSAQIGSITYSLEKVTEDRRFEAGYYYLAVADTDDNNVYISTQEISRAVAIQVLASTTPVDSLSGTGKTFVLSTYTYLEIEAYEIALTAADLMGLEGAVEHDYHDANGEKRGIFYRHYHPGAFYLPGTAHSFYGTPDINW